MPHSEELTTTAQTTGRSAAESPTPAQITALAALFEQGPAALLTGAGISTDSGIPDYRGAGTPPRTPMNIEQFMTDEVYRRRFWAGARIGALHMRDLAPNPGHVAVAELESEGWLTGVVTQNVDGLHAEAGSINLAEIHGAGAVIRCVPNDHRFRRGEVLSWLDAANPGFAERAAQAPLAPDGDADVAAVADLTQIRVPVCPACGSTLRPDVVYFGEHVPQRVFAHAEQIIAAASSLIIAGSSLAVNTGIRLVHRAEQRGLPLAVINRGPTAIDHRPSVAVRLEAGTTETFTALRARLGA